MAESVEVVESTRSVNVSVTSTLDEERGPAWSQARPGRGPTPTTDAAVVKSSVVESARVDHVVQKSSSPRSGFVAARAELQLLEECEVVEESIEIVETTTVVEEFSLADELRLAGGRLAEGDDGDELFFLTPS